MAGWVINGKEGVLGDSLNSGHVGVLFYLYCILN